MHASGTVVQALEGTSDTGLVMHGVLARRERAERLVCFMPAAQTGTGTRRAKLFSRWSWQTVMPNQHVMALSDPALGLDGAIRGAWFLHPERDLLEEMAQMVRGQIADLGLENDQVLFYGSSLGGFGALGMASLLPGACAIAEIPQIDVAQWPSRGSIKAMETALLKRSFAEHRQRHPEMVDVRERFRKSHLIPPFLLVTNESDMSIGIQRELMEDVAAAQLPRIGEQRMLLATAVSGHAALPQADALALIEQWSIRGGSAGVRDCALESVG